MWIHTGIFLIYGILFLLSRGLFSKSGTYLAGKLSPFISVSKKQMRMVLILLFAANCMGTGVTVYDQVSADTAAQGYLIRPEKGEGSYEEELIVSDGENQESIVVEVKEEPYTETEVISMLEDVLAVLDEKILGENESFERIEYPMNLMTGLDGIPVVIDWNTSQPIYLDWEGKLGEEIPADGVQVEITGKLSLEESVNIVNINAGRYSEAYSGDNPEQKEKTEGKNEAESETQSLDNPDQYTREYHRTVTVFPENKGADAAFGQAVSEAVEDYGQSEGKYQYLPDELDGKTLQWSRPSDRTGIWIVFFMGIIGILLIMSEKSRRDQKEKEIKRQMILDYPGIIQKLVLLMRAGVSSRRAIRKIALDYRRGVEQGKESRRAYEEIVRTYYEMEQGVSEEDAYRHLGNRCEILEYRTLSILLVQNLKKGSSQFFPMMEQECSRAFEERKKCALIQGEEAGTKLLIPMMLMLLIVLLILIVPSFLSLY